MTREVRLPAGYVFSWGGQFENFERAKNRLALVVPAALVIILGMLVLMFGNLRYALTARNFNPVIAMAAGTCMATADHIVPVGVIPPDDVMTPAPIVDFLVANA